MIAASAVLVVIAFVTLIIGIFQTGLGLIWVSIASSVLAAIFLLLGVVKGRPPRVATAGAATYPEGAWGDAPATTLTEAAPPVETSMPPAIVLDEIEEEPEEAEEEVLPPRRPATPARPAASRASASRPAAKAPAKSRATASKTAKTPAAQQQVVVIPDRDKFHKTTCRYAKGPGTMKLTKSEARREGYKACGVCKP